MQIFCDRLKSVRGGRTLKEVASLLGINYQNYQRYESGEREPDLAMLHHIGVTFGVSVDWLLGLSDAASSDFAGVVRDFVLDFEMVFNSHWDETLLKIKPLSVGVPFLALGAEKNTYALKKWPLGNKLMRSYRKVKGVLEGSVFYDDAKKAASAVGVAISDVASARLPAKAEPQPDAYWHDLVASQQATIAKLTALLAEGRATTAAPVRSGGRAAMKTA